MGLSGALEQYKANPAKLTNTQQKLLDRYTQKN